MQYTAYVHSMADAIAIAISEAEEATLYKQGEEANVILQAEQVHQAEEESYAELVLNAVTAALEDRDMSYESRLEWQIDRLKGEVAYYDHRPIVAAYLQKAADRLWYELESEQLSDSLEEYFYGGTDTGYYRAQERANKLEDERLAREAGIEAAENEICSIEYSWYGLPYEEFVRAKVYELSDILKEKGLCPFFKGRIQEELDKERENF